MQMKSYKHDIQAYGCPPLTLSRTESKGYGYEHSMG